MQQPHSALRRCLGKGRPVSHGNKGASRLPLSPRPKTNPRSALGGTGVGRRESKVKRRRRPGCAAATAQNHIRSLPYLAKSSECKVLGEGGSFRIFSQPGAMQGLPRQTSPSTSDTASDTANPKNFAMLSGLPRHTGAEPAPDAYPCEPAGLPKSRLGILQASPRAVSGSWRPPQEPPRDPAGLPTKAERIF